MYTLGCNKFNSVEKLGGYPSKQGYPPMGTPQNFKISAYADDIEGTQNVLPVLGQKNSVLRPKMVLKDKINWYYVVGDQKN